MLTENIRALVSFYCISTLTGIGYDVTRKIHVLTLTWFHGFAPSAIHLADSDTNTARHRKRMIYVTFVCFKARNDVIPFANVRFVHWGQRWTREN